MFFVFVEGLNCHAVFSIYKSQQWSLVSQPLNSMDPFLRMRQPICVLFLLSRPLRECVKTWMDVKPETKVREVQHITVYC